MREMDCFASLAMTLDGTRLRIDATGFRDRYYALSAELISGTRLG
jgi:hypothetical protein